eukprot:3851547-Alexandrium_andersonii.AAC.1
MGPAYKHRAPRISTVRRTPVHISTVCCKRRSALIYKRRSALDRPRPPEQPSRAACRRKGATKNLGWRGTRA